MDFEEIEAGKLVDGVEPRLTTVNFGESKAQETRESRDSVEYRVAFEKALLFGWREVDRLAQGVDEALVVEAIEKFRRNLLDDIGCRIAQ